MKIRPSRQYPPLLKITIAKIISEIISTASKSLNKLEFKITSDFRLQLGHTKFGLFLNLKVSRYHNFTLQ